MPIAVLGLSGHCNGYWATVAVICNSRNGEGRNTKPAIYQYYLILVDSRLRGIANSSGPVY